MRGLVIGLIIVALLSFVVALAWAQCPGGVCPTGPTWQTMRPNQWIEQPNYPVWIYDQPVQATPVAPVPQQTPKVLGNWPRCPHCGNIIKVWVTVEK